MRALGTCSTVHQEDETILIAANVIGYRLRISAHNPRFSWIVFRARSLIAVYQRAYRVCLSNFRAHSRGIPPT